MSKSLTWAEILTHGQFLLDKGLSIQVEGVEDRSDGASVFGVSEVTCVLDGEVFAEIDGENCPIIPDESAKFSAKFRF